MKNILLPTDFSENSRNAINYALELYKMVECRFILMNAYLEEYGISSKIEAPDNIFRKRAEYALSKLFDELLKLHKDARLNMEKVVVSGRVVSTIRQAVKEFDIDMVVMGTKGASGLKRVFMGSNTASVIKKAKQPVLAIPENACFKAPKRIAFAVDRKKFSDSHVLDPMTEIVSLFESEVLTFKVITPPPLGEVNGRVIALKHKRTRESVPYYFYNPPEVDPEQGIIDFMNDRQADMLVMVAREYTFLEKLFHRSLTMRMAMHTDIPLLTLHDTNKKSLDSRNLENEKKHTI